MCALLRVRVQIVLAKLFDEGRATQVQEAGRVRDRAIRLCERARDQLLFDVPQVFTQITVEHTLIGYGIEQAAVDRALELASTRYCSVSAMLGKTAEIVHTTQIIEAEARPNEQTPE